VTGDIIIIIIIDIYQRADSTAQVPIIKLSQKKQYKKKNTNTQKDGQCACIVTLRRVLTTIIAVTKQ
jgi:hypothetical protein